MVERDIFGNPIRNPFGINTSSRKRKGLAFGGLAEEKPGTKRKKCPPHLKSAIRRRWWNDQIEGECFCCGRKLHYDDADVGHIKAASKGGEWAPDNCRLICRQCNGGMRTKNMKIYMRQHYPERYNKLFPKDTSDKPSKPPKPKPPRTPTIKNPFDVFAPPKKGRNNPWGF